MGARDVYIMWGRWKMRSVYVGACVRGVRFGVEDTCWVVRGDNLVKGQGYVGGFGGLRRSAGLRVPWLRVVASCHL